MKRIFLTIIGGFGLIALFLGLVLGWKEFRERKEHQAFMATLVPSAAPNVLNLPDTISLDYLGEQRDVYVYLPPDYHAEDTTRYPVLYFFDGDNLFDAVTAQGTEWEADEVVNATIAAGGPAAILVGVPASEDDRSREYKPFPSPHVRFENTVYGKEHMAWYANELKAWVDERYRTLPGPEHTGIGGCSLGGLMAYYGLMEYPEVYHLGVVFSPSLWVDEDSTFVLHERHPDLSKVRMFLDAGELETPTVINAEKARDLLLAAGLKEENLYFDVEPGEGHWHMTWRKGFKKAYPWILEGGKPER